MADTNINLEDGWKQHKLVTGGWILDYIDPVTGFDIAIVTGPPGSGLGGVIAPGKPTTYYMDVELPPAWLPELSNPMIMMRIYSEPTRPLNNFEKMNPIYFYKN